MGDDCRRILQTPTPSTVRHPAERRDPAVRCREPVVTPLGRILERLGPGSQ